MKSAQKWEEDHQMKIHKNRIKRARNLRKSSQTREASRGQDSNKLKLLLQDYDLQQHFLKLNQYYSSPEDLLKLSPSQTDSLIQSLNLYPGQLKKFQTMLENLSKDV